MDDDDKEDKSAIFYMHEQDMRDLLSALEKAQTIPKVRMSKEYTRFETLKRQLRAGLK